MNFRMIMAIIFVILLLTFGILQEFYLEKVFSDFNTILEEIGDVPDGFYDLEKVVKAEEWWKEQHRKMELFLPHIPLNEITSSMGELKGAVIAKDDKSSIALLNKIDSLAEAISEMSSIRIGNIL